MPRRLVLSHLPARERLLCRRVCAGWRFSLDSTSRSSSHWLSLVEEMAPFEALAPHNAVQILALSNLLGSARLRQRCIEMMTLGFAQVIEAPSFPTLPAQVLTQLLLSDELVCQSEETVLEAILRWLTSSPSTAKLEIAERLFDYVRWELLPDSFRADMLHVFEHRSRRTLELSLAVQQASLAVHQAEAAHPLLRRSSLESLVVGRSMTPPAAAREPTAAVLTPTEETMLTAGGAVAPATMRAADSPSSGRWDKHAEQLDCRVEAASASSPLTIGPSLAATAGLPYVQGLPVFPLSFLSAGSPNVLKLSELIQAGAPLHQALLPPLVHARSVDGEGSLPAARPFLAPIGFSVGAAVPLAMLVTPPASRVFTMLEAVAGAEGEAGAPTPLQARLRHILLKQHALWLRRPASAISLPTPPSRCYSWGTLRMSGGSQPQLPLRSTRLECTKEQVVGRSRKSDLRIGQNAPMPYISGAHFRLFHQMGFPPVDVHGAPLPPEEAADAGEPSPPASPRAESELAGHKRGRLEAWIEDLSQNGTFVNGVLLGKGRKRRLRDKDRIELVFTAAQQPHVQPYTFPSFTYVAPGPPMRDTATQTYTEMG